jgi:hypothetical protein
LKDELSVRSLGTKTELKEISFTQVRRYLNYFVDLGMLITANILFITGLIKFLNIWGSLEELSFTAAILTELHDWSGIILGVLVFIHLLLHWKWIIAMTRKIFKSTKSKKQKLNYFIDLGMLLSFLLVFITGILKFPSLRLITQYFSNVSVQIFILHDWAGIVLTMLTISHGVLHWKWIVRMTKRIFRKTRIKSILVIGGIIGLLLISLISFQNFFSSQTFTEDTIRITGIGTFKYNPKEMSTVRNDLFKNGHFSIFDILVYLDNKQQIDMDYSYDNDMDTYVINSLNGSANWWYTAFYDGGWGENVVFRMDHYPYKPKMYIRLFQHPSSVMQKIFNVFREGVQRRNVNNGTIIIPSVIISSANNNLNFVNVTVSSHNLRNDFFQNGVITAIDVIMSLGDQGLLTYKLNWYNTIGTAEVKNYYVDEINQDEARGTCGFVYEAGDWDYEGFAGNHIHIPADIRIITSPEYEKWFYICL